MGDRRPGDLTRGCLSRASDLQISLGYAPDELKIDAKLIMRQSIAHPGDLFPRDLWATVLHILRELLDGLADNLELTDNSVLTHAICHERLTSGGRVLFDIGDGLANVTEVNALIFHRARASSTMR